MESKLKDGKSFKTYFELDYVYTKNKKETHYVCNKFPHLFNKECLNFNRIICCTRNRTNFKIFIY